MKKQSKLCSAAAILLALVFGLSFTACGKKNPDKGQTGNAVTVTIGKEAPSTIRLNETVKLTVTVSGTSDKRYVWSTDNDDVLAVSTDNVVSVKENVNYDTIVTVTATSAADPNAKATHTFTVQPALSGQVGNLTAAMIEAISGPNITLTGTVTDVFRDFQTPTNSSTSEYEVTVKMEEGKWYGKWGKRVSGQVQNELEDNYARGEQIEGSTGHELLRLYTGIDNEVKREVQRSSSNRRPLAWENNRLWNQMRGLGVDVTHKFIREWDEENGERYAYQPNWTPDGDAEFSDDSLLMTYLAVSLTPMMSETFYEFYFIVEDNAITKIVAVTEIEAPTDSNDTVLYNAYTQVELTVSAVGTTVVPEPASYGAPSQHGEELTAAINNMKAARNYTFAASETSVSAPSVDPNDYSSDAISAPMGNALFAAAPRAAVYPYHHHTSANPSTRLDGGLGTLGYVTEDLVLFEEWGAYTSYQDDPYYVQYSGYRQFDGYYEFYSDGHNQVGSSPKYLAGYKHYTGDMWERQLPQWNISPNIFEYRRTTMIQDLNGDYHNVYVYELRDSAVTPEVARQIAMDGNEKNGYAAAFKKLSISVDAETNQVIEIVYPYDISAGTYTGYMTIRFYNYDSTTLDSAYFNGSDDAGVQYYVPRTVRNEWSQYDVMYYQTDYEGAYEEATADVVLNQCYGPGTAAAMPKPEIFMEVMGGDNVYGPFFDYDTITDEGGNVTHGNLSLSFNMSMEEDVWNSFYDIATVLGPNGSLTNAIKAVPGWTYSGENSGERVPGSDTYYGTYVNESKHIMLVVENNATNNFFCYVYAAGAWQKH